MKDLVALFHEHGVEYAIVGGFAVNYYGYLRMTQDIDFLVVPSQANAGRVMAALREFGFGGAAIPQEILEKPGGAIHLGVEPNRIDLLTSLEGADADEIVGSSKRVVIDGTPVQIISFERLVEVKQASRRLRDQADAEELLTSRRDNE